MSALSATTGTGLHVPKGDRSTWPDLSGLTLRPTMEALHLWTQVVGKVRLMLTPWENHGWHVPLYLSPRGFGTGLIPIPGRACSIEFDLIADVLVLHTSRGDEERLPLTSQSVAAFYEAVLRALQKIGVRVTIDPMPVEIVDASRFDQDDAPREFDPSVARAYWRAMLEVQRVLQLFRTRFTGKVSPIHLFWGAFDLAVTRFSGRSAPPHPGGAPFMNDAIAREAYSQEVSSAGFWPNLGNAEGPCFYSYAYPSPAGYEARVVGPLQARFDAALGEFILPYAAVREAPDPDAALLEFLQSTYEAAAELSEWNRPVLERAQGSLGRPPNGS